MLNTLSANTNVLSKTIVSQDVALFTGTLRSNLDPFGDHTDLECLDVLDRCHLTPLLKRSEEMVGSILDTPISSNGSLSAGERQLVALARAVLRRTNIVIMDEATSQIDSVLDDQVGLTIVFPQGYFACLHGLFEDSKDCSGGTIQRPCYYHRPQTQDGY